MYAGSCIGLSTTNKKYSFKNGLFILKKGAGKTEGTILF